MKKLLLTAFVLASALPGTLPAHAQTALGVNAQYGMDFEEFQLGAEFHVPFRVVSGLSFVPNFEYYLRDEPTTYSINGDVHYSFGQYTRSFTPYVGLGLAITRMEFERRDATDVGLNLIGGANFRTSGNAAPFFQIEYRASDFDDLSIGGGVRFLMR